MAGTPSMADIRPTDSRTRRGEPSVRLISAADAATPDFRTQWDALCNDAAEPNPFFEPWFTLPSLAHFEAHKASTIAAQFDGDRLVGLMPLSRPPRYYGYLVPHCAAWLHDNAFCSGPLIARGYEHAFWRGLLDRLDSAPGRSLFLHLPELPADGRTARALDAVLAETDRYSVTVDEGSRAMLSSDLDAEAYLSQAMSAKKRKELRRQRKRLSEEGSLTVERHAAAEGLQDWIAEFLGLEAAGWKGERGSALANAQRTRALFADALAGAASAGRLERLALRLDGKPIAMLANFVTPPGVFSFKTAFDEAYARFSPGLLLQIENLDLLDRSDIAWADSCAAPGHSMIERIWREKRRITSRNIAIGGPLRRALFRAMMAYETRGKDKA
ncbi:GNAT family N-acetyltransferase [Erythrobacter sp. NAP1]|uniref:GNAT family N-acetyltransferase n=1 Tax=Erythrobacter sp. NAP1 TaxID=237727 RepID=UPI001F51A787|nr:GNAT family N-acetyltransferase [Erythrobacter sp. NAP1]